ncbi:hypothetical protein MPSEU_001037700 [Mayamaea pseudoterrestris]|nr:hypothetical protein MPSEU_001037700 [Mayamaea pseudoterrestris]
MLTVRNSLLISLSSSMSLSTSLALRSQRLALVAAAKKSTTSSSLTLRSFHASSLTKGNMTPPLPAFKRSPPKQSSLIENYDALWDDGVAPELALDFDMPSVSSGEALQTFMLAFGAFAGLYGVLCLISSGDDNPALSHASDCVDKDWSNHEAAPLT